MMITLHSDDLWVMLTGILVALACGIPGCFIVLRRMAMMGDALSHAVLPGIVVAFLISGERNPLVMLLAAGSMGIATAYAIHWLQHKAGLQADASMGVLFTFLFAVGVILISKYASKVDLDQDCVLYGEIAYVPLQQWTVAGKAIGPKAIWVLGPLLAFLILGVLFFFKELKVSYFDPQYAAAIGIPVALWHQVVMGAVSFTTVASFESVGAILVVAFLVVNPATAWLLSKHLRGMLLWTCLLGTSSAVLGYMLAAVLNVSIAGSMAVLAGIQFALVFLWQHLIGEQVGWLLQLNKFKN